MQVLSFVRTTYRHTKVLKDMGDIIRRRRHCSFVLPVLWFLVLLYHFAHDWTKGDVSSLGPSIFLGSLLPYQNLHSGPTFACPKCTRTICFITSPQSSVLDRWRGISKIDFELSLLLLCVYFVSPLPYRVCECVCVHFHSASLWQIISFFLLYPAFWPSKQ